MLEVFFVVSGIRVDINNVEQFGEGKQIAHECQQQVRHEEQLKDDTRPPAERFPHQLLRVLHLRVNQVSVDDDRIDEIHVGSPQHSEQQPVEQAKLLKDAVEGEDAGAEGGLDEDQDAGAEGLGVHRVEGAVEPGAVIAFSEGVVVGGCFSDVVVVVMNFEHYGRFLF